MLVIEHEGDRQESVAAWVAPFAVFMLLLVVMPRLPVAQPAESIVRVGLLVLTLLLFSRRQIRAMRLVSPVSSIALGVAVFVLWIGPDLLFPGWRSHWLFQNGVTGTLKTTIPPEAFANPLTATLRVARAALLVPVIEELFWRGWLPRWLANPNWRTVPLGTYTTLGFVATALLFASEHGPYWEVGLVAGVLYNAWMWRTRSLGDLVLAHAVTNACLSGYVLWSGNYSYWM